jgi:2-oxoglutarate ferredoxin oxidoreductase subunit alpha
MRELTIGIGGAAGDGLDKSGDALARTCARLGLHVYAHNSYQSVIRGGHIWLTLRLAEDKVRCHGDRLDLAIALNQDSIERHAPEVNPGGRVLFNGDRLTCPPELPGKDVTPLPVPVGELLKPLGKVPAVMQNSVLAGAAAHLLGLEPVVLEAVVADVFGRKAKAVVAQNTQAARAGFSYAREHFPSFDGAWTFPRTPRPFLTGNEAVALGAIAAGCKYYSAYPMTPVSNILHYLAAHGPAFGMAVKQCEDELAVINTAIGAGFAGVRAMCATSGGGFALMTEAIGLAGMLEVPVVIVEGQRAGPSTGVPTKSEQGDLNQVLGASQGDYPRVVLAPTDVADAFRAIPEAFNLAESFQIPVIVVTDLALAEHHETVEADDLPWEVPVERGEVVAGEAPEGYLRYRLTPSGVSPRVVPGTPGGVHVAGSDEHDEAGILVSDVFASPPIRRKMHEKRMRKLAGVAAKLTPPARHGAERPEVMLVGWGSTGGVIREAVDLLGARGVRAAQVQVRVLAPFQTEAVRARLEGAPRVLVVEENFSGQFARLLKAETGISADGHVRKYDGEPFTPAWIADRVQAILAGRPLSLRLTEAEAREAACHYIRTRLGDASRPVAARFEEQDGRPEPVWRLTLADRTDGHPVGDLEIGADTGATHGWHPGPHMATEAKEARHGHA